jgi:hypothetical protein
MQKVNMFFSVTMLFFCLDTSTLNKSSVFLKYAFHRLNHPRLKSTGGGPPEKVTSLILELYEVGI